MQNKSGVQQCVIHMSKSRKSSNMKQDVIFDEIFGAEENRKDN